MHSEILINEKGIVQSATTDAPPKGGVSVVRRNREFSIIFDDQPTPRALISLIRTLRSTSGTMTLSGCNFTNEDPAPQSVFMKIAQLALQMLEAMPSATFNSQLETFSLGNPNVHGLSEELMPLAQLNLLGKEVPSALMHVINADIKGLVSVGQTMSMRLCFLSFPSSVLWPETHPQIGDTLEKCLSPDAEDWLSIVYETAFALKSPLFHHGLLTISPDQPLPFQRLIYPLASASDRPHNYRILSVACITGSESKAII